MTKSPMTLFLRVFLPFAFVYFLSYIVRGVNAVIFPFLERDIGLTAADLGLLTSAFFLFFAACQPLLGVALDRYGPRRLQTALMAAAAAGAILFALSTSLPELILARGLIGLGFAGGLMAAMKAITLWYPRERWGLITGFHMMAGGAGSMAATVPVEWSLSVLSWQGLFFWIAGCAVFAAAWLFVAVPERPPATPPGTLRGQFRITGIILVDSYYWRIQPLLCIQQLAFIGCITLWIGPWLRDAGGVSDIGERANIQLYATAASTVGFAASGLIADALRKRGVPDLLSANLVTLMFILVTGWLAFLPHTAPTFAWILFGFLGAYPIQYFPLVIAAFPQHYSGRVSTGVNLLVFTTVFAGQWAMGKVVGLWPATASGYAADGYSWAFGALFILQLAALAWLVMSPGRPMYRALAAEGSTR
ncbi:MAG: MFS transporter [Proteobacteria bacterium]|nr:MFS transporter [Pseudomonadota bacterium]